MEIELKESSTLQVGVVSKHKNGESIEQYTATLEVCGIRLEGPYDESYITIPLTVFKKVAEWVERKTNEHN